MWPFKKTFSRTQERDAIYAQMMSAAEQGDANRIGYLANTLRSDYASDPLLPTLLTTTFRKLGQKDLTAALLFCVNYMGQQHAEQEKINHALQPTLLRLLSQLDQDDIEHASLQAAAAQKLFHCATHAEDRGFALRLWGTAINTLMEKDPANRGLAAACNAACLGNPYFATQTSLMWAAALTTLAKTNQPAAKDLALAFVKKHREFNAEVPYHITDLSRAP